MAAKSLAQQNCNQESLTTKCTKIAKMPYFHAWVFLVIFLVNTLQISLLFSLRALWQIKPFHCRHGVPDTFI